MASLDSMKKADKGASADRDVELAVRLTIKLLRDGGGMKIITDALKSSNDPAQVIGQFLAQIVGKLAETLDKQYGIHPSIFLAQDGWLQKVLDYIEQALNLPSEFSDQIYEAVLETIKAAAMGYEKNGGQPGQPAQPGQPQQAQQPMAPQGQPGGLENV